MYKDLNELYSVCKNCRKCELSEIRTNVVFGVGNPDKGIMFIGEGPGENEDLQGKPFVGRAGKLLDLMLEAVELSRETDIYIANIVKCRPPKNRDPFPEEQSLCKEWLDEQIRIINPKIIVSLGRISAAVMMNPDIKISKEHGIWTEKEGRLMMAMLHPAAVLRNPKLKPEAFDDFVKLKEKIQELQLL